MRRTVKLSGDRSVTIVSASSSDTVISNNDAEMDKRVQEAVRSAINRATVCKKPIAKYDRVKRKAYIVTADGEKNYV